MLATNKRDDTYKLIAGMLGNVRGVASVIIIVQESTLDLAALIDASTAVIATIPT